MTSKKGIYVTTVPGIAKITSIVIGVAPLVLSVFLYLHYEHSQRPKSGPNILIHQDQRALWEIAFLIVVAASMIVTLFNILFYTCFTCLSTNVWTKRFDCGYFAIGGMLQAALGFVMVASALTSTAAEPLQLKYAAGFLGILTGIVYWGAATLVNSD